MFPTVRAVLRRLRRAVRARGARRLLSVAGVLAAAVALVGPAGGEPDRGHRPPAASDGTRR